MPQEKLIEHLRRREEHAATELLREYAPLMRYIIKPILSDTHDVEDCLSEVVMRIWESFDSYDEGKGSLAGWITAITRNTAISMLRKQNRRQIDEMEVEPHSSDPSPEEILLRAERRRELRCALGALPTMERNLFYRKYYYMQSTKKIAAELSMTERSVEGKLYRIKKKLRRMMRGGDDEG